MGRLDHPADLRQKLFDAQHGICHWCGCLCHMRLSVKTGANAPDSFTVDHITSRGNGGHPKDLNNIVGACYRCNQARNTMIMKHAAGKPYTFAKMRDGRLVKTEAVYDLLLESVRRELLK